MTETTTNKDSVIVELLARLSGDLGIGTFEVVDHWDSDPQAVGIARPSEPRHLAYISADEDSALFYLELETPGATQDPADYVVAGRWDQIAYDQVRAQIAKHLKL